jgi:hypothetical protein
MAGQGAGGQPGGAWQHRCHAVGQIRAAAPQVTAMVQLYLQRLAVFVAPASMNAAENALRQFARWMVTEAALDSIAAVRRDDIEDYKVWLVAQPRAGGQAITAKTHRQRMRTVRRSLSGSSGGTGLMRRPATRSSPGHPEKPGPLPKFPPTATPPAPRSTSGTSAAASGWPPATAARWTGTSSAASSPAPPGRPSSTRTGCAAKPTPGCPATACAPAQPGYSTELFGEPTHDHHDQRGTPA